MPATKIRGEKIVVASLSRDRIDPAFEASLVQIETSTSQAMSSLLDFEVAVDANIQRLAKPKSPVFTYTNGILTRIDYADGTVKILSYTGKQLSQIDSTLNGVTNRKIFTYTAGALSSISETTL